MLHTYVFDSLLANINKMKIVTWNCNGAFRKKFESISSYNADLYIIQECEDPKRAKDDKYLNWASNYLWIGDSKNKGVGIFANDSIALEKLNWSSEFRDHSVKYFLPCLINKDFQLLAVWTHKNNSPNFGYIGQFWKYLKTNEHLFDKIIIAGDFNSNTIWDQWDRWWNHTDVVNELKTKGVESLYHLQTKEEQGQETRPSFFLQRNRSKPYHIDYIFGSKYFQKFQQITIGNYERWIEISDHLPMIYEK